MLNDPVNRLKILQAQKTAVSERIQILQSSIESTSINYDRVDVVTSPTNAFEVKMAELLDLKSDLMALELSYQLEMDRIYADCQEVFDAEQITILAMRLKGVSYNAIAMMMHYSSGRNVYRKYKKGIEKYAKLKSGQWNGIE